MTALGFLLGSVVVGCLLYLPFFLWFRRHPPSNDSPLAARMNYTAAGWAFLAVQSILAFAGLFLFFGHHDTGRVFGRLTRGNPELVKWYICVIVGSSVVAALLRSAGIALERPAAAPAAPPLSAPTAPASRRAAGFRLVTLFGVPITVHRSYLWGGLFIALIATTDLQGIAGYCVAYAALFAIHEAGHAIAARSLGLKVHSIDLSGIGGLCRVELPTRSRDVWLVFSAGLAAQVIVLSATLAIVAVSGAPTSTFGTSVVTTFTWVNAMLFAINLLPGRTFHGQLTDGGVLWGMARHQLGKGAHPLVRPVLPSRLFEPSTSLLDVEGMAPPGFQDGIEILNDDKTPMEFVTAILQRHAGLSPETAASTMLDIHVRGGTLLPFPRREAAEAAAEAIARDTQAQHHPLVCRAVSISLPAAPAASLSGA